MKREIERFLPIFANRLENSFFWIRDEKLEKQLYLSPSFDEIWGMPRDRIYEDPLAWMLHLNASDLKSHNAATMIELHEKKGKDARFQVIYRINHPEKGMRWIKDTSFPLYENNHCIGFAGIAEDITNEKEYEVDLKKQKDLAEMANQAKSEFIANMSHDIRTAITGMLGIIYGWKDRSENKEDQQDASLLEGCTNELLNLCNEVIEIVKIDSGQIEQSIGKFSLPDLIKHNLTLLMPAAKHKQVELRSEIDANTPVEYIGKKVLLDRILLNLLSNSIKFTEQGHISIKASMVKQKDKTAQIKIVVTDTGIGMPNEKLESIFEKFVRLTPSYQGLHKGTGLGLYTVKQFTTMLGGTIKVSSEVNKGSKFTITIPLTLASDNIIKEKETKIFTSSLEIQETVEIKNEELDNHYEEKTQENKKTQSVKVLVVEDNALAARTVQNLLLKFDCEIDVASTGKQALDYAENNDYQLIFMDIGLPDQTGLDVTVAIRKFPDKKKASIPIVALTGHVGNERKQECIQAGMNDMLSKPLTPESARKTLENFTSNDEADKKTLPPIDLDLGIEIIGDRAAAKEILIVTAENLTQYLLDANNAYRKKDYDKLIEVIYTINSGLCYCGAPELTYHLKALLSNLEKRSEEKIIRKLYDNFIGASMNFQLSVKSMV